MEVACLECGEKFTTSSTLPECPECGGSDVDLACRFSAFSHRVDTRTQVMLDDLFPSQAASPSPTIKCEDCGAVHYGTDPDWRCDCDDRQYGPSRPSWDHGSQPTA